MASKWALRLAVASNSFAAVWLAGTGAVSPALVGVQLVGGNALFLALYLALAPRPAAG